MAASSTRPTSWSPSSSRTDRLIDRWRPGGGAAFGRAVGLLGQADAALGAPEPRAIDGVRDPAVHRGGVERLPRTRRLVASSLPDGDGELGGRRWAALADDRDDLVVQAHVPVPGSGGACSGRPGSRTPGLGRAATSPVRRPALETTDGAGVSTRCKRWVTSSIRATSAASEDSSAATRASPEATPAVPWPERSESSRSSTQRCTSWPGRSPSVAASSFNSDRRRGSTRMDMPPSSAGLLAG